MKKFLFLSLTTILLINSLIACSTTNSSQEDKKLQHNLRLIVTSDIHAGVNDNWTLAGVYEKREEYKKNGDYTLLIDDGDLLQGGFISSITEGSDLIDIMNVANYDVLTFGNHDFDYGMDKFISNTEKLNSKYISCNFTKNNEPAIKN